MCCPHSAQLDEHTLLHSLMPDRRLWEHLDVSVEENTQRIKYNLLVATCCGLNFALLIWPWNTERSRAKANRVLPREHAGHSKHPLPTTQEKILHIDITRWSTPKSD